MHWIVYYLFLLSVCYVHGSRRRLLEAIPSCNNKSANCTSMILLHGLSSSSPALDIRITSPLPDDTTPEYVSVFEDIYTNDAGVVAVNPIQSFDFIVSTSGSGGDVLGNSYFDEVVKDFALITPPSGDEAVVVSIPTPSSRCSASDRSMVIVSHSTDDVYVSLPRGSCSVLVATSPLYCIPPSATTLLLYSDPYCSIPSAIASPSVPATTQSIYCSITAIAMCVSADSLVTASAGDASDAEGVPLAVTVSSTAIGLLLLLYLCYRRRNKAVTAGDIVIYKLPSRVRERGSNRDYGYGLLVEQGIVLDENGVEVEASSKSKLAIQPLLRVIRTAGSTDADSVPPLRNKTANSWISTRQVAINTSSNRFIPTPEPTARSVPDSKENSRTSSVIEPLSTTKGLELAVDPSMPLLFLSHRDQSRNSNRIITHVDVVAQDAIPAIPTTEQASSAREAGEPNNQDDDKSSSSDDSSDTEIDDTKPLLLTYLEKTQSLRNRSRRASSSYSTSFTPRTENAEPVVNKRFTCFRRKGKIMDEPLPPPPPPSNATSMPMPCTTTTYKIQKAAYLKRVHLNIHYYSTARVSTSDAPETSPYTTPPRSTLNPSSPIPESPHASRDTISSQPLQLNLKSSPRRTTSAHVPTTLLRSITTSVPPSITPIPSAASRHMSIVRGNSLGNSRSYSISPRRLPSISLPTGRNSPLPLQEIIPSHESMSPAQSISTPMTRGFSRIYSLPRGTSLQERRTPELLTPVLYSRNKNEDIQIQEVD